MPAEKTVPFLTLKTGHHPLEKGTAEVRLKDVIVVLAHKAARVIRKAANADHPPAPKETISVATFLKARALTIRANTFIFRLANSLPLANVPMARIVNSLMSRKTVDAQVREGDPRKGTDEVTVAHLNALLQPQSLTLTKRTNPQPHASPLLQSASQYHKVLPQMHSEVA